ncbi:hypothetical protein GDO81_000192 [Engystomops pustulosus]|uniref:ADP-ribosyl cyclase/cyclic ADP-ribose hydrolase 1 n=1 Tax=Engystomops pustulosus TaxID=76066 RepID=A0AAV7D415_ENGPU|nr:hypothetical protein GDO81_000192 [Engystomops pustulosus]
MSCHPVTAHLLLGCMLALAPLVLTSNIWDLFATGYQETPFEAPGTTSNIRTIVIDRCRQYWSLHTEIGDRDCDAIWEELLNAVQGKDPCTITEEDYRRLTEMTAERIPCDKTLLWSRTNKLVLQYATESDHFLTLAETLLGFMFNELIWCGTTLGPGFNFTACPAWDECEYNSIQSFWKMASAAFAQESCGIVNVMLNGSAEGDLVKKQSILRTVEIPNLDPSRVSEVKVFVIIDKEEEDK